MHQPIALHDDDEYYPQVIARPTRSTVTLYTVYHVSYEVAQDLVKREIAAHERKFSVFGIVSVVAGGAIGWVLFGMMG